MRKLWAHYTDVKRLRSAARQKEGESGEQFAQKCQAVDGNGILGGLERAPHRRGGGDRLVLGREGLDHDRAGIARVAERVAEPGPVDVVRAGGAAVVGRSMDVRDARAAEAE